MTLHVYNPEHDIALASNQWNFSLPKAAKLTRSRFWDVPLRWAEEGDLLLCWGKELKVKSEELRVGELEGVRLVTLEDLSKMKESELPDRIEPWGWDRYIVHQLVSANKLLQPLCPSDDQIQFIREMSGRKFATENLLPRLVALDPRLIGEARTITSASEIEGLENIVLKAPWSCSGRGVRIIKGLPKMADLKWTEKTINDQGCIMLEPLYCNLQDFAMEFCLNPDGSIDYRGLNVFKTHQGRYICNQDTEELNKYALDDLLDKVRTRIIDLTTQLFAAHRSLFHYIGPFGVDMMVVGANDGTIMLHPCVEMNLRRTMGNLR